MLSCFQKHKVKFESSALQSTYILSYKLSGGGSEPNGIRPEVKAQAKHLKNFHTNNSWKIDVSKDYKLRFRNHNSVQC